MKIAFICVGNSARSQIAEALARHHAKRLGLEGVEFYRKICGLKPRIIDTEIQSACVSSFKIFW